MNFSPARRVLRRSEEDRINAIELDVRRLESTLMTKYVNRGTLLNDTEQNFLCLLPSRVRLC